MGTPINVKPEIREIDISSLRAWEENPRSISPEAVEGLRSSIKKFGYVDLVVVNSRNMQIISGHQRVHVLIEEGITHILCVVVDLDDLAAQTMAITLNNQNISGYFNEQLLPILEKLRKEMPEDYIDLRLKQLRDDVDQFEQDKPGNTLPDNIPETPKFAVTKPGDIWILGDHRLLCGNSTDPEQVKRLMDGNQAELMATDPPYLVDYTGKNRPGGGKDWTDTYHEVDITDARKFFNGFLTSAFPHVKENAAFYIWHADRRLVLLQQIFDQLNLLIHQNIIWVKPCTVLTYSVYPWRHEPCVFGWRRGHKPFFRPHRKKIGSVWTVGLMRDGDPESPEFYSDLWEFGWDGKKRNTGQDHPTVKPTEIFAIPMRVHTHPGDICYEPFSGSGSQIIAAERVNRRCFAVELEPVFCDVAVRRWEEFTGRKAERGK